VAGQGNQKATYARFPCAAPSARPGPVGAVPSSSGPITLGHTVDVHDAADCESGLSRAGRGRTMPRRAIRAGQRLASRMAVSGRPDRCRTVRPHLGPMILVRGAPWQAGPGLGTAGRRAACSHPPRGTRSETPQDGADCCCRGRLRARSETNEHVGRRDRWGRGHTSSGKRASYREKPTPAKTHGQDCWPPFRS
jgi:hypothetical protein